MSQQVKGLLVEKKQPMPVLVQQFMLTMQEMPAGSSKAAHPDPTLHNNKQDLTDLVSTCKAAAHM